MLRRLVLLALLATPAATQTPWIRFPGGAFMNGTIVTVTSWQGAPALLVLMPYAPSGFMYFDDPPLPTAWAFEMVAAGLFDSRPCAVGARAELSQCEDYPGRPFPAIGQDGFATEITLPFFAVNGRRTCYPFPDPRGTRWHVDYTNGGRISPCLRFGPDGPQWTVLILRVV